MTTPSMENVAGMIRKSNVMGILGDMILSPLEYKAATFADIATPPVIGLYGKGADKVLHKINQWKEGKDVEFTESDIKYAIKMLPFSNLPVVGGITNHIAKSLGE
jgi:hypothetical protein